MRTGFERATGSRGAVTRWFDCGSNEHLMRFFIRTAAFLTVVWAFAPPAHAYLDPGTGSTLLQGLIGGAALAIGVVMHYWRRVRAWVPGVYARRRDAPPDA